MATPPTDGPPEDVAAAAAKAASAPASARAAAHTAVPPDTSIGGLFRRLVDDLILLVRAELRLAGGEVRSRAEDAAPGLGAIALGAMLISVAMLCLLGAMVAFLAYYVGVTWAALIVAAGAIVAGGGLIWWGISRIQLSQLAPSRAVANLRRNAELLKGD